MAEEWELRARKRETRSRVRTQGNEGKQNERWRRKGWEKDNIIAGRHRYRRIKRKGLIGSRCRKSALAKIQSP